MTTLPQTDTEEALQILLEWRRCKCRFWYFANTFCYVEDPQVEGDWIPFRLWPAQLPIANLLQTETQIILLKARQVGLTWLCIAYALWLMIFWSSATVLLFSKRDDEAVFLLDHRLKGMYKRLPIWMQSSVIRDSAHEMGLANGSLAMAFPTTAGDSYTGTFVMVDEADLIPDLDRLLSSVKPTIENGGRIVLVGRADKSRPRSPFKRIYLGSGTRNSWVSGFLPWHAHPGRTPEWYNRVKAEVVDRTGSYDELYEQYPASPEEALAPRELDKRFPRAWLVKCWDPVRELKPAWLKKFPPGAVQVWRLPRPAKRYVLGVDPAEGNPTSDDSAITILDADTWEEVCHFSGRFEITTFSEYLIDLSKIYNKAPVLTERNNHGHAVIIATKTRVRQLKGEDRHPGYLTTAKSKSELVTFAAGCLRDGDTQIRTMKTYLQFQSLEGASLAAPEGEHDDCVMSYLIALAAARKQSQRSVIGEMI